MSSGRLVSRIPQVEAEVAKLLAEAEAIDAAEDAEFGADRRGDELPAELQTREGRLAKMREAKAAIEAEAAERAGAAAADKARKAGRSDDEIEAAAEEAAVSADTGLGRCQAASASALLGSGSRLAMIDSTS